MNAANVPVLQEEDLPHYTYDDYVCWEGRWEIIHGIPYAMTPSPPIEHQDLCGDIYVQLKTLLKNCPKCKPLLPVDWQISEDIIVQPDVMVVCGEREKIIGKTLSIPPVLIFEILSPSTRRKDKVLKYRLYQEAGVKYYCIVDPETSITEIFQLIADKYRGKDDTPEEKLTFDLGPCRIDFDFAEIFKEMIDRPI